MPAETAQRINNSVRIDKSRQIVFLAGTNLKLNDVLRVADGFCEVVLADEAFHKVAKAYQFVVSRLKTNLPLYGVNTGFGKLAHISIPEKDLAKLQLNLIRSHCCGVGNPLSIREVRAILLLRANTLAMGHSGVRPLVVETLIEMLNRGISPVVPEKESVGASIKCNGHKF